MANWLQIAADDEGRPAHWEASVPIISSSSAVSENPKPPWELVLLSARVSRFLKCQLNPSRCKVVKQSPQTSSIMRLLTHQLTGLVEAKLLVCLSCRLPPSEVRMEKPKPIHQAGSSRCLFVQRAGAPHHRAPPLIQYRNLGLPCGMQLSSGRLRSRA